MAPAKKQTKQASRASKALDHVSTHTISKPAKKSVKSESDKSPKTQRVEDFVESTLRHGTPVPSIRNPQITEGQASGQLGGHGLEMILPELASIKRKLERIETSTKPVNPIARVMDDVNGNALNSSVNSDAILDTVQSLSENTDYSFDTCKELIRMVGDTAYDIQDKADDTHDTSCLVLDKVADILRKVTDVWNVCEDDHDKTFDIWKDTMAMAPKVDTLADQTDEIFMHSVHNSNATDKVLKIVEDFPKHVATQATVAQIANSVNSLVEKHNTYMRSFERMHDRMEKAEKLLARGPQVNVVYGSDNA